LCLQNLYSRIWRSSCVSLLEQSVNNDELPQKYKEVPSYDPVSFIMLIK